MIWALSAVLGPFRDYQIADIAVYVVAIAGLTVLIGLSGQISLGHGAFMAVGAYATALLQTHLNWPLWALFPVSALIAAVTGAAVGVAAPRLHRPYPFSYTPLPAHQTQRTLVCRLLLAKKKDQQA